MPTNAPPPFSHWYTLQNARLETWVRIGCPGAHDSESKYSCFVPHFSSWKQYAFSCPDVGTVTTCRHGRYSDLLNSNKECHTVCCCCVLSAMYSSIRVVNISIVLHKVPLRPLNRRYDLQVQNPIALSNCSHGPSIMNRHMPMPHTSTGKP